MKNVQTIQLTGKVFKGQKILAVMLGIVGLIVMFKSNTAAGAIMLMLSITWFYTVKMLVWWNHA